MAGRGRKFEGECFGCGESGHSARFCTKQGKGKGKGKGKKKEKERKEKEKKMRFWIFGFSRKFHVCGMVSAAIPQPAE